MHLFLSNLALYTFTMVSIDTFYSMQALMGKGYWQYLEQNCVISQSMTLSSILGFKRNEAFVQLRSFFQRQPLLLTRSQHCKHLSARIDSNRQQQQVSTTTTRIDNNNKNRQQQQESTAPRNFLGQVSVQSMKRAHENF